MNFELANRLAMQPARLTALLSNLADTEIDALVQDAVEDTDVFAGVSLAELPSQTNLYRIRLFAEQLLDLVEEADGTAANFRERRHNPRDPEEQRMRLSRGACRLVTPGYAASPLRPPLSGS